MCDEDTPVGCRSDWRHAVSGRDLEWLRASTAATVTVSAVADVLGVDARTVTRAIDEGQLPALRVGRRLLVPRVPLLALLTGAAQGGDA